MPAPFLSEWFPAGQAKSPALYFFGSARAAGKAYPVDLAVSTLVPAEEYLSTVYEPDCDYVDGEVIERNRGESDHSGVHMELAPWLANRRRKTGVPELRVEVAPGRYRVPDIAVTTRRIPKGALREPPFLCLEVLSPEDRLSPVEARIDDFLAFGVQYVSGWSILGGEKPG